MSYKLKMELNVRCIMVAVVIAVCLSCMSASADVTGSTGDSATVAWTDAAADQETTTPLGASLTSERMKPTETEKPSEPPDSILRSSVTTATNSKQEQSGGNSFLGMFQNLLQSPILSGLIDSFTGGRGNHSSLNGYLGQMLNTDLADLFTNGGLDNILSGNILEQLQTGDITSLLRSIPGFGSGNGSDAQVIQQMVSAYVTVARHGVSTRCLKDWALTVQQLMQRKEWALRMADALGKPPSGLLASSQTTWLGDYDECRAVRAITYDNETIMSNPNEHYSGKYCVTTIPLKNLLPAKYAAIATDLYIGTCIPSTCTVSDMNGIYQAVIEIANASQYQIQPKLSECREERKLEDDAIAVIVVLAILGMLIVVGTLYDVIAVQLTTGSDVATGRAPAADANPEKRSRAYINGSYKQTEFDEKVENGKMTATFTNGQPAIGPGDVAVGVTAEKGLPRNKAVHTSEKSILEQILLAFSVYTNGVKLLSTQQGAGSLGAVNGVRFLSMAWVILGHTIYFSQAYSANLLPFFGKKMDEWTFMGIIYASVSVDSFFALSGMLVAYLTLREMRKLASIRRCNFWFQFYFHRFWRLTPPYMLVIMFGTVILPYMFEGPFWKNGDVPFMGNCRKSWWINLLYVNNYVHPEDTCLGWSWYLANDMQFYIISPLILVSLFYNVVVGSVICILLVAASCVTRGIIVHRHQYSVQTASAFAPLPLDGDFGTLLYIPSYAKIGPYIVGLFTGYLLYRCKLKCRIPKALNLTGWFLCISTCCLCVYSLYSYKDEHILSNDESAAFQSVYRTAWGIAVCWIVFACATCNGGWINQILAWRVFIPLGRLTYCAYLVHPLVMVAYYGSRRTPLVWTNYEIIYQFISQLVMSYAVAFLTSLAFESPMMGLEKAIFRRGRKK